MATTKTAKFFLRYLDDSLRQQFTNEHQIDPTSIPIEQLYGFGKYLKDDSAPSLRRDINNKAKELIEEKIEGKVQKRGRKPKQAKADQSAKADFHAETKNFLYDRLQKLDVLPFWLDINTDQLECYATYLDKTSEGLLNEFNSHQKTVHYLCGAYSVMRHQPLLFQLKVTYSLLDYFDVFPCEMAGFHKNTKGFVFQGNGQSSEKYLRINLERTKNGHYDQFNIIGFVDAKPMDLGMIIGVFSGVSFFGRPTCGEILMIKANENFRLEKEKHEIILQRYLMLSKGRIRTKDTILADIEELWFNQTMPNVLNKLVGQYYVLNFDSKKSLVVSCFSIEDDYHSYFQTVYPGAEAQQVCLLSITRAFDKLQLHISTYKGAPGHTTYEFRDIIGNVFIDLPEAGQPFTGMLSGVSCTTGPKSSNAGHIMLIKTDESIKPHTYEEKDIPAFVALNEQIKEGVAMLESLSASSHQEK